MLTLRRLVVTALYILAALPPGLRAQQGGATPPAVARLVAEPAAISLVAGQTRAFTVRAFAADGREIPNAFVRVMAGTRAVRFTDSTVTATVAGRYEATASAQGTDGRSVTLAIPIQVTWPRVTTLTVSGPAGALYAGRTVPLRVTGMHADGSERPGLSATWQSANPKVATINRFGDVTAVGPGTTTVTAEAEGATARMTVTVVANPVAKVEITVAESQVRQGDVVRLTAVAKRANGSAVADAPISWSYTYVPDDSILPAGLPGGAGIVQFDRFPRPERGGDGADLAPGGAA